MNVQYLSNDKGHITAVQVAIEDWERLKLVHPEIADSDCEIPEWQLVLIDNRLADIRTNPESIKPISTLIDLLDKEE